MTLFTNGFVTLKIPKDFKTVVNKGNFVELSLINPQIPLRSEEHTSELQSQ